MNLTDRLCSKAINLVLGYDKLDISRLLAKKLFDMIPLNKG